MSLQVVIVNYRTPALALDCLRSIAGSMEAHADWGVVLVDNYSGDNSAAQFEEARRSEGWQRWLSLLPLTENGGFAAGNNAALRRLLAQSRSSDYFLLLNPDTIAHPGALSALVEFMDGHPEVGIVGSRLENRDGTPQRSAFRFPTLGGEWENGCRLGVMSRLLRHWVVAPPVRDHAHPTDWVSGASMVVRREVFDAVGLLDESYFLYFEETDFCLQAARAGWSCWYVPESRVIHLVGQSTGIGAPRRRMPRFWFESRHRYFLKNHGQPYTHLANLAWAAGHGLWRARRRLQRKPDLDPPSLWWDFIRFNLTPDRARVS
jgi:N-acetylglucosaminyl-diphospho-decaprenol L-rhamnosyltransferase